jgi:hypothetical protein
MLPHRRASTRFVLFGSENILLRMQRLLKDPTQRRIRLQGKGCRQTIWRHQMKTIQGSTARWLQ